MDLERTVMNLTEPMNGSNLPQWNPQAVANVIVSKSNTNKSPPVAQEKHMSTGIKTTKRNYLFTVQKRVGGNWQRITDAVFSKRSAARECVKELRNVTGRDYRVRKMVIAAPTRRKVESAS